MIQLMVLIYNNLMENKYVAGSSGWITMLLIMGQMLIDSYLWWFNAINNFNITGFQGKQSFMILNF